jgi:cellulose synthase/poly-beta-1,6-N-acetylglucosamine synthase-like glycosyltransferase
MVIGVCTYNRGAAIVRTLEALAALDPGPTPRGSRLTRIAIIDNRSSDDTAAVVDRFIAAGPAGVPMLRWHEATPGKTAALRRLFSDTHEPIVGVIDDDTLPDPGWARGMLELLEDQPRAGAVGGPVPNIWESGPTHLARVYRRSLGDQDHGPARTLLADPASFLMGASTAYRRAAVESSGWLEGGILECRRGEQMECGEDAELCLRIRRAGWEVWYEPAARMGHLIPARRQSGAYLAALRESICRSEPWLRWIAEDRGTSDRDRRWAREQRRRARSRQLKTILTDWRPRRRRIRLAERRGRVQGWDQLLAYMTQAPPISSDRRRANTPSTPMPGPAHPP